MSQPPHADQPQQQQRSAGAWVKLLLVWGVGLVVWTLYLALIVYVVYWIL